MKKYVLFISYDGLLDPLGHSQILPYIYGLNNYGYNFIIISYEKKSRDISELKKLSFELKSRGILWFRLEFIRGPIKRILRIVNGAMLVRKLNRNYNISLIHLRALQPALIYWISLINKPFLYDMRAFAGQWVDMGAIKKGSLLDLIINKFEYLLIKKASALVVLDESGARYLEDVYKVVRPFKVIPTSTEVAKYKFNITKKLTIDKTYKFVFLGGARYPYLPKMALEFIKELCRHGYNCEVDFINEGHRYFILNACKEANFPNSKIRIFSVKGEEIFKILSSYDCGLAFIATGPWIRMCSPTKIGEYLSAGLHIVGLEGLEVLNRLSKETNSVDIISTNNGAISLSKEECLSIINKINSPKRRLESIKIATKRYDLKEALKTYYRLYSKIIPIDKRREETPI